MAYLLALLNRCCGQIPFMRPLSVSAAKFQEAGKHSSYSVNNGVAVIKLDSPGSKVNSLNEEVMQEMEVLFNKFQADPSARAAVLISGKPGCFIAGADIKMIENCKSEAEATALSKGGQDFFFRMESSPKPIVAAIMGSCMGGGLETAMACQYRIAIDG